MQFVSPELAFLLLLKGTDISESRLVLFYFCSKHGSSESYVNLSDSAITMGFVDLL